MIDTILKQRVKKHFLSHSFPFTLVFLLREQVVSSAVAPSGLQIDGFQLYPHIYPPLPPLRVTNLLKLKLKAYKIAKKKKVTL